MNFSKGYCLSLSPQSILVFSHVHFYSSSTNAVGIAYNALSPGSPQKTKEQPSISLQKEIARGAISFRVQSPPNAKQIIAQSLGNFPKSPLETLQFHHSSSVLKRS